MSETALAILRFIFTDKFLTHLVDCDIPHDKAVIAAANTLGAVPS
jgi:hypothetical protein